MMLHNCNCISLYEKGLIETIFQYIPYSSHQTNVTILLVNSPIYMNIKMFLKIRFRSNNRFDQLGLKGFPDQDKFW